MKMMGEWLEAVVDTIHQPKNKASLLLVVTIGFIYWCREFIYVIEYNRVMKNFFKKKAGRSPAF